MDKIEKYIFYSLFVGQNISVFVNKYGTYTVEESLYGNLRKFNGLDSLIYVDGNDIVNKIEFTNDYGLNTDMVTKDIIIVLGNPELYPGTKDSDDLPFLYYVSRKFSLSLVYNNIGIIDAVSDVLNKKPSFFSIDLIV